MFVVLRPFILNGLPDDVKPLSNMNTFKDKVKKKKNKISMYTIGNFSPSSTHFNHGVI